MKGVKEHTFDMTTLKPRISFVAMYLDPSDGEVMGDSYDSLEQAKRGMADALSGTQFVPIRIYEIEY
jgi:hypothetical protein